MIYFAINIISSLVLWLGSTALDYFRWSGGRSMWSERLPAKETSHWVMAYCFLVANLHLMIMPVIGVIIGDAQGLIIALLLVPFMVIIYLLIMNKLCVPFIERYMANERTN